MGSGSDKSPIRNELRHADVSEAVLRRLAKLRGAQMRSRWQVQDCGHRYGYGDCHDANRRTHGYLVTVGEVDRSVAAKCGRVHS